RQAGARPRHVGGARVLLGLRTQVCRGRQYGVPTRLADMERGTDGFDDRNRYIGDRKAFLTRIVAPAGFSRPYSSAIQNRIPHRLGASQAYGLVAVAPSQRARQTASWRWPRL